MAILICVLVLVCSVCIVCAGSIAKFIGNHLPETKRLLLCIVAVAIILACIAFLPPARADADFYPHSAVVISFDVPTGVILLEDGEGHFWALYWEFTDDELVELGDVFSLLMWEAGTPTYQLDDEILDATNSHIKAQ